MTSLGSLLAAAKARFTTVSTSPSLDAQLLMAHVLDANRAHVIAHADRELTAAEAAAFTALADRRAAGEPLAYIFGKRAFYDRELAVSADVLIPRPETELLVELAVQSRQAAKTGCVAADIGTGSGAIAVTFAAHVPHAAVYAVDISANALAVARRNAVESTNITFLHGDLLAPLVQHGIKVDLLLANLPYIASAVVPTLDVSHYEPTLALDGGADGLDLIRLLLADAPAVLQPGALMLLEIGADQGEACAALVQAALPSAQVRVLPDLAGLDRIVRADLPL